MGKRSKCKGHIVKRDQTFNKYWTDKQCKNIGRIEKAAGKNKIKIEDCKAACKLKEGCNAVNFCSSVCILRNCKEPIPPPMGKRSKCKGHIVKRGAETSWFDSYLQKYFSSYFRNVVTGKQKKDVNDLHGSCDCGTSAKRLTNPSSHTEEISGGDFAADGQFPWVVRLLGGCPKGFCGGALVSRRIVLSAHHCTTSYGCYSQCKPCDHSDGKRIAVVGSTEIYNERLWKYPYYRVVDVRTPPNGWLVYGDYESHDFAMLILEKPVEFNDKVRPICLPHPDAEFGGKEAIAAGWGRTHIPTLNKNQSPHLKYVPLKVNPRKFSHRFMFGTKVSKKDDVYQDPCSGDSGGPLMYLNKSTNKYVLIGTVQGGGFDCRDGNVYTWEGTTDGMWNKVTEHMGWIEKNMRQLGETICR